MGSLSAMPKDKQEEGPRAAMLSAVPVLATGRGTSGREGRAWAGGGGAQAAVSGEPRSLGGFGLRVQDKVAGLPAWLTGPGGGQGPRRKSWPPGTRALSLTFLI